MPSFVKLSRTVSKVWSGHECSTADGRTDGQMDRLTDRQTLKSSEGITLYPPLFVAGHKNTNKCDRLYLALLNLADNGDYGKECKNISLPIFIFNTFTYAQHYRALDKKEYLGPVVQN